MSAVCAWVCTCFSLVFAPFWEHDLHTEWASALGASDASTNYRFGVWAAKISPSLARRVGRAAARGDNFVRLSTKHGPEKVVKRRKGTMFRIPLTKRHFKPIVSSRALQGHHCRPRGGCALPSCQVARTDRVQSPSTNPGPRGRAVCDRRGKARTIFSTQLKSHHGANSSILIGDGHRSPSNLHAQRGEPCG